MSKEFFETFPTLLQLKGESELQVYEGIGAAAPVVDKREAYVKKYYDTAVKVGKEFKLNPIVILAQAALESGWGTSLLARESNNFFGVTAYGNPNGYWKGAKRISTSSGLPFRIYDNVDNGFRDFANLITKKYKDAHKASDSVSEYARLIANSPYINEKNGDNRSLYKQIIIKNAAAIIKISYALAKKSPRPFDPA